MSSATNGSSPWGKPQAVVTCSLQDVMSEQLATHLQDGENDEFQQSVQETKAAAVASAEEPSEADLRAMLDAAGEERLTDNDEILARLAQLQYDREYNAMLQKQANKFNGSSKVTVSFDNYKMSHPHYEEEEDELDDEDDFEPLKSKWEESRPNIGMKGYSGSGKNITTKHDKVICGRKNAERLMEFPPEFESGDGEGMDMQLPNKVYNKLKRHSMNEAKRSTRHSEKKEHSTAEKVVDAKTRVLLFKLVNSGLLESLGGCIAEGKESSVFEGKGGSLEDREVPERVAVKVYKTTLLDFRTREKYVHGDHRFASDDYKKKNPRKIIKIWAMKEVANLLRMDKFGVPCPSVVKLKNHVLVMSMIGKDGPAPKLHDAPLSVADSQDAYEQTVEIMKTLHTKCALVHADLSDYSLLWHDGKVYVIDVSQAVDLTHPQAFNFLYRDCTNISTFFQKLGVHGVLSPEQLFNEVTGLDIQGEGAEFDAQVQRYDKERKERNMVLGQGYAHFGFDYFFQQSQQDRENAAALAAASAASTAVDDENDNDDIDDDDDSVAEDVPLGTSPLQMSKKALTALVEKYMLDPTEVDSSEEDAIDSC